MLRSSGIVMPISALPGPFGIGCLGEEAIAFAKKIRDAGFSYWQILPFGPTGSGDSPYQSFSTFAGNAYFIDLRPLHAAGWLSDDELSMAEHEFLEEVDGNLRSRVDYGWLWDTRLPLLRTVCSRIDAESKAEVWQFAEAQSWLSDYADYMTIKAAHEHEPWWQWPRELRLKEEDAVRSFLLDKQDERFLYMFVQWLFFEQWLALKQEVNTLGVSIIGDIPIYVASDSCDVWANRQYFEFDDEGNQLRGAGVPPDIYSPYGQLWGNPLYRWDLLQEDGYRWWIERIRAAVDTCDIVRLDHFRGFESFWAVNAGATTAQFGVWEKGPAMDLFNQILRAFPLAPFIVEDLGFITDEVRVFLSQTGLPGMKVLQFHFDADDELVVRPHGFEENLVAYASTHDSDTLFGWVEKLGDEQWRLVRDCSGANQRDRHDRGPQSRIIRAMLRALWQTPSTLVMVQLQDVLGQGNDMRTNVPGVPEGNWRIRFTEEDIRQIDVRYYSRLNEVFQRALPDLSN